MDPAPPTGRATLDFFAAQAGARRRTAVLVLSFAAAIAVVTAIVAVAAHLTMGGIFRAAFPSFGLDPAINPATGTGISSQVLLASAAGVLGTVGIGGTYHAVKLSSGGGAAVATMLGGVRVDRGTDDPGRRRLVNVVEEMAIAAGSTVPDVYVLEAEAGINAFAAGHRPGQQVVCVTRGAVDALTRDELQGVVAHEMSHLLNQDVKLDLWLMSAVGGLTCLSLVGRVLLRGGGGGRRSKSSGKVALIGLALLAAGAIGSLCGRLVRYAVARQREWLADASAVQFTRNPDGLAGALRKIAAQGSGISNPHAHEASHLFFASSATRFATRLFSTHPPIEARIARISAQPLGEPLAPAPQRATPSRAGASPGVAAFAGAAVEQRAVAPPGSAAAFSANAVAGPEHLAHAAGQLDRLPSALRAAAHEPFGACALTCALVVGREAGLRAGQLAGLAARDAGLAAEVVRLLPEVDRVGRADRGSLLALTIPALGEIAPQAVALAAAIRELAVADGHWTTFEWAIARVVQRRLAAIGDGGRTTAPRSARTLGEVEPEALDVLSAVAWSGQRDDAAAQLALEAGLAALGVAGWHPIPRERLSLGRLDGALTRLDAAVTPLKLAIVDACVAIAMADRRVDLDEAELVRGIAAALGVTMPPLLAHLGAVDAPR